MPMVMTEACSSWDLVIRGILSPCGVKEAKESKEVRENKKLKQ
jgi:hypothetical protein